MAFLIGYHSRAGTPGGLLSHTLLSRHICNFRINGKLAGEAEINTAICGSFEVPTALVTGNSELQSELESALPAGYIFCSTKNSLGNTAAICKTPTQTYTEIYSAAKQAAVNIKSKKLSALSYDGPITMEVEAYYREFSDSACIVRNVERTGERSFSVTHDNAAECFKTIWRAATYGMDETPSMLR